MQKAAARGAQAALDLVRVEIGEKRYAMWFRAVEIRDAGDGVAEICAPNVFVREWLDQHYGSVLESCLKRELGGAVRIRYAVDLSLAERLGPENAAAEPDPEPAPAPPAPAPRPHGLNDEFRLDTFVVGACNRLAHSAALAICEQPGTLYNPLFIYGASGLGKTHLLQGVAREFRRRHPGKEALYLTGEAFVNQYVESVKKNRMEAFRERFRNLCVLVVDDVHVLSNKGRTQEEFLHTFNACSGNGRQVVMASDSHPEAIASLRKELRGRFVAGLLARLDPPSFPTRLDILKEKARKLPARFPDDVLAYLAQNVKSSVRALEGALTTLAARSTLLGEPISVAEVRKTLAHAGEERERAVSLADIEDAVAARFGVSAQDLHSASKRRDILQPRQLCMLLARRHTSHSLSEIGAHFGRRGHVSVLYGARKTEEAAASDPEFARALAAIEESLKELR